MTKTAHDRHQEGYLHWDMVELGWKYNMDNIDAAILLPQMDRLDANLAKREALAACYEEQLARVPGVSWPKTLPGVRHPHHLFTIWVEGGRRDEVVDGLQRRGIPVVVNYRAIHLLTYFRQTLGYGPGDFPSAELIGDMTVSLPFYPNMPLEHVDFIAGALNEILH
jgi:UDP-4-amino-4-deoxy-L-arabinose-oxoglutarate aminotransferase